MSAELVQAERVQQNTESNVPDADQLTTNPDTRQSPGLLRRLARPAVMMSLLPAAFGGVSPAIAAAASSASGTHEATAHKVTQKKATPPTVETPVQKATTSTIKNIAIQIIADFNQAKGSQPYQGVAYDPAQSLTQPGIEGFNVEYPTGTDTIVNNGTTENIGTGGYSLEVAISYPRNDNTPPTKINLNNVIDVGISESLDATGFGANYFAPFSDFSARGNNSSSTKDQWDLLQEIDATPQGGIGEWAYVTGAGNLNKGITPTTYTPLPMQELQSMAGEAQTILDNAKQYIAPSITPALETPLGPPTKQLPPLPLPS